jgi:hypothetical protein
METAVPFEVDQPTKKQPLELLQSQVDLLSEIYRVEENQQRVIGELQSQIEELTKILVSVSSYSEKDGEGLLHGKIENVNVPFWSLVGFLLKLSFASIPAAVVLGILWIIVIGIISLMGILPLLLSFAN